MRRRRRRNPGLFEGLWRPKDSALLALALGVLAIGIIAKGSTSR